MTYISATAKGLNADVHGKFQVLLFIYLEKFLIFWIWAVLVNVLSADC